MTEEHFKAVAKITLVNSSIIGGLSLTLVTLTEKILPLIHDEERDSVIGLLHELEQLQAIVADLAPSLEQAKKELGLE